MMEAHPLFVSEMKAWFTLYSAKTEEVHSGWAHIDATIFGIASPSCSD
jgi:hypothetical protein